MGKRAAAVDATRRRIVEATMALHGERGILGTSWEDIARRADVAPATVYRHFPTLEELLPACGALVSHVIALPDDAAVAEAFAGLRGPRPRVQRMVQELFALYERGADTLAEARHVGHRFEPVAAFHREAEARFDAVVQTALEPLQVEPAQARVVRALVDFDAWRALRARGLEGDAAVEAAADVVEAYLARRR
jgi:AcrR family transcriptional regulator